MSQRENHKKKIEVEDRNHKEHNPILLPSLAHQHRRPQGSSVTGAPWLISPTPGCIMGILVDDFRDFSFTVALKRWSANMLV